MHDADDPHRHLLHVSAKYSPIFGVLPVAQVRDCIEKENVSGQPKGDLPPLPPPGHKIDIKVTTTTCALSCSLVVSPCLLDIVCCNLDEMADIAKTLIFNTQQLP